MAMESVCAVVGSGAMGHGIAEVLARTQPLVWLYDPDCAALERALTLVRESLERLQRHGLIDAQVARETPSRLRTTTDLARAVEQAWLAVEAAPEELGVKQELFAELDRLAPVDALLATNSSSFTLAQVGARVGAQRRARIVGSHFFLPAQIVPLVEVSRGDETPDDAVERVCALWERCGKGAGAGAARRARLRRQPTAARADARGAGPGRPKDWPAPKMSTAPCASASACASWSADRWRSATWRGWIWPLGSR